MTGNEFVRIIERQLAIKGISKGKFYEDCGISSSVFSNWRSGKNQPSQENIQVVSEYLDIPVDEVGNALPDDDTVGIREVMRNRPDLRLLWETTKDCPPSEIYEIMSQIAKLKEGRH